MIRLYFETDPWRCWMMLGAKHNIGSNSGSIVDHLNEFNMVTNQLSSVKVDFDDDIRALLILWSFPQSWNDFVMVVSLWFKHSKI
jgi:hypothetical protein